MTRSNGNETQDDEINFKEQLKKLFKVSKLKLKHIENYVNKFENISDISVIDIEIRINGLNNLLENYNKLIELLFEFESDDDFTEYSENLETFNSTVIKIKSTLSSVIYSKNNENRETPKPGNLNSNYHLKPKLPNLPIPSFNENPGEWIPFKNTFKALVHDDPDLNGIVKFSYLLDRLNDETKNILGTYTLSEEGYNQAWETILENFDNQRRISDYHIEAILNLPFISKDNSKELRKLINICVSYIASLENCYKKIDGIGEQLIINIVIKKLDFTIRKEWEGELESNKVPTWEQLLDFLKRKCRILDSINSQPRFQSSNLNKNSKVYFDKDKNNKNHSFVNINSKLNKTSSQLVSLKKTLKLCQICNKANHFAFDCPTFLSLTPQARYTKMREFNICINCLKSSNHKSNNCTSSRCKTCDKSHHTLLHFNQSEKLEKEIPSPPINNNHNFYVQNKTVRNQIILPTAICLVKDNFGKFHECRALLDSGSQSNFITSEFAEKLKFDRSNSNLCSVTGLNQNKMLINESFSTNIKSKIRKFEEFVNFLVVPKITNFLPQCNFDISLWDIPKEITLADPMFGIQRPIDILLGSEIFFKALFSKQISVGDHLPKFQETAFGYIAAGKLDENVHNFSVIENKNSNLDLMNSLRKLFDLDSVSNKVILSKEERYCENHFTTTTCREKNGRYIVSLPLKENVSELGESRPQALRRFMHLERKFELDPKFHKEYSEIIKKYDNLNHMNEIDESLDSPSTLSFYLPHHAVFKLSSSSTKTRVVFDGSCKSTTDISLNDVMMVGPVVQKSCFDITLRFRKHKYVYTSDVHKMYRQIKIEKSQRPLQQILWRTNKNEKIRVFELNTVTFGTASAPFLATRTLNQIAIDEKQFFPDASSIALRDFYVDDCLSGADTIEKAKHDINDLKEMLSRGGFQLLKWCANHPDVLNDIAVHEREVIKKNAITSIECIKTLGIAWKPDDDKILFLVPSIETSSIYTKRVIASQIAKLYDHLD